MTATQLYSHPTLILVSLYAPSDEILFLGSLTIRYEMSGFGSDLFLSGKDQGFLY